MDHDTDRQPTTVTAVLMATRPSDALAAAIASVVAQDPAPDELVLFGNGAELPAPEQELGGVRLRLGRSDRNLGVAGGRNAAAALATGELLLFVDDDATLAPGALAAARARLAASPRAAAVAFNVEDPVTGRPALWYHPFDRETWSGRAFEAVAVIGCGHLVRTDAFRALGGYWDGYFRELEEIDLSWRLIDRGWQVLYEPEAVVRHPERTQRHTRFALASHLKLAWRLLPAPLAARQTLFLLGLFGVRGARHGELGDVLAAVRAAGGDRARIARDREVLRPETVRYLRRAHASQSAGKRLQWSLRPLPAPAPLGGHPPAGGGSW